MLKSIEGPINAKAEQIRAKFQAVLDKTNKESPRPQDVKALTDLLVATRVWSYGAALLAQGISRN
jgi:hypothetical protein